MNGTVVRRRPRPWRRVLSLVTAIAVAGTVLIGCSSIDKALNEFNNAITEVGQLGANYSGILADLEAKLKQDGQQFVAQVDGIFQEAAAVLSSGPKCDFDFLRGRVENDLENIRYINWLYKKQPPPPVTPVACYSVPPTVKVDDINSGAMSVLTLEGFDFNPAALDYRLPSAKAQTSILESNGHSTPVPDGLVVTQPYTVLVNVNKSNPFNFQIPADATKLEVTFPNTQAAPFDVPIISATVTPPPPKVTSMKVTFNTTDDDKTDDSRISLIVANSQASFLQNGTDGSWYFDDNTSHTFTMTVQPNVTVSSLQNQPYQVCIQGNTNSWHFNMIIIGTVSDNTQFTITQYGIQLGNPNCLSYMVPYPLHTFAITTPTPIPTPTPTPTPRPCGLIIETPQASTSTAGLTVDPYMRSQPPPICR